MNRMRFFFVLQLFFCWICCNGAVTHISKADREILNRFWKYAQEHCLAELTVNERVPCIARFFLNTPYKSNTLNVNRKELPVINLRELDCVTFVENVLALSFLPEYSNAYESAFVENITKIRYRDGKIEDYTSRLHYSSDWLYEMQQKHWLTDLTQFAGGIVFQPQVDYMTRHYDRYPLLCQDTSLRRKMKEIETRLNRRTYYYIPKNQVAQAYGKIKNGDIILMTTNIKGLDTSHVGFAYKQKGTTYLLHASSAGKKVVISEKPLQEYLERIATQTGIMIARVAKVRPT